MDLDDDVLILGTDETFLDEILPLSKEYFESSEDTTIVSNSKNNQTIETYNLSKENINNTSGVSQSYKDDDDMTITTTTTTTTVTNSPTIDFTRKQQRRPRYFITEPLYIIKHYGIVSTSEHGYVLSDMYRFKVRDYVQQIQWETDLIDFIRKCKIIYVPDETTRQRVRNVMNQQRSMMKYYLHKISFSERGRQCYQNWLWQPVRLIKVPNYLNSIVNNHKEKAKYICNEINSNILKRRQQQQSPIQEQVLEEGEIF